VKTVSSVESVVVYDRAVSRTLPAVSVSASAPCRSALTPISSKGCNSWANGWHTTP
jgi:hypothetical protein